MLKFLEFTIEAKASNMNIQYVTNNIVYATQDHFLFKSTTGGKSWDKIGKLPARSSSFFYTIKDRFLRSKAVRMLRRNIGISDIVVLNSGTILLFYDKIYRLGKSNKTAQPVFDFKKNNTLAPLINGVCVTPENEIFFGEYNCDKNPHKVRIMKGSNDGKKWQVYYEFEEGSIRHIHSMRYDRYRRKIIICTGDLNCESNMFYWDPNSNELSKLGGGDQGWRAVSVIPTKECLFWGTDAGKNNPEGPQNFIYAYDFNLNKRIKVQRIDNPAYFSTKLRGGYFVITTTFEGQTENPPQGTIWASSNGSQWQKILTLKYRRHRNSISRFGILRIPNGDDEIDDLFFTPFNLEGHFNLFRLTIA